MDTLLIDNVTTHNDSSKKTNIMKKNEAIDTKKGFMSFYFETYPESEEN